MADERDGERNPGFLQRGVIALLATAAVVIALPDATTAQDIASVEAESGAASVVEAAGSSDAEAEREAELRQQSAVAGLLVLALLCVVFLTLIVCVVLWARRMRLLTIKPLPDQHPGDPLWYLRKPVAKTDDGGSDD